MGKVIDSYVESLFLKDSCDGSGLNTSENSKDSHPKSSGGFFEWYCSSFIDKCIWTSIYLLWGA